MLPIRNEAAFIEENLLRILRQDYPQDRFEIIVADGMSNDGTREILDRFVSETDRVTVIDNREQIVPTGLNAAIRRAKGEIIIRIDGHVVVADDFIKESVRALRDHPDAWAVGGPIVPHARTACGLAIAAAMSHPIGVGNAAHRRPTFEGYGEGTAFPATHSWIYSRVGYYDESLVRNQDDEFYYRINVAGGKFFITPRIKYTYFVRERLAQLFRQYYQYSFWRIPVMLKHRQPTTLRQVVPSLFYLAMLIGVLLGAYFGSWLVALTLPTVYASALLLTGITKIPSLGVHVGLLLPVAICTMHAGYAWGMIHGWLCHALRMSAWNANNSRVSQLSR